MAVKFLKKSGSLGYFWQFKNVHLDKKPWALAKRARKLRK